MPLKIPVLCMSLLYPLSFLRADPLSLDEVLSLARKKTPSRVIIGENYKSGLAQIARYRSEALPSLDFSLQSTRSSLSLVGQAGVGDQKRAFGNEHGYTLELRSPIYSFGRLTSVYQIASLQTELTGYQKEKGEEDYYLNIIGLYNMALQSQAKYEVAKLSLAHSESTMSYMETEFRHGAVSQADHLRAKSRLALASAHLENTKAEAGAATERLKIMLDLGKGPVSLSVKDLGKNRYFGQNDNPESETTWSLRIKKVSREISDKTVSYRRASYLPTLSLIAGVTGNVKTHRIGTPAGEDTPDFQDLFTNDRITSYGGIALTWNLFNGLGTSAELHQAVAEATVSQVTLRLAEKEAQADLKEATGRLAAAEKSLTATQEASEAMKIAYDQSEKDFRGGTISLTQLLEIQRDYQDALLKNYEAWSGKIQAVAELRKNLGKPVWGGKP